MSPTLTAYESSAPKFLGAGLFLLALTFGLLFFLGAKPSVYIAGGAGLTFILIALTAWPAGMTLAGGPSPQRRSRRDGDSAVSPVIGVILMVAITVILAAVVFVLVSNLSKNTATNNPSASFSSSGTTATTLSFQEVSQTEPFDWTSCSVRDSAGAVRTFTINGVAPVATPKSTAGDVIAVTGLTTKTAYQLVLLCGGATVGSFTGTTT